MRLNLVGASEPRDIRFDECCHVVMPWAQPQSTRVCEVLRDYAQEVETVREA